MAKQYFTCLSSSFKVGDATAREMSDTMIARERMVMEFLLDRLVLG